ncbi:hypothetical protein [Butyrivibrio sp. AE3004]|uniref:hypothetical protein n=1 Tax=Butyrivibrio sp. AE3004 TaxID=1506994 RepID=UPI000493C462|nr:hypothetical protein [Butyrivibrio sp. AE3004]
MNGSRLYSIKEMREMIEGMPSVSFLRFLRDTSDSIREIAFSWVDDENTISEIKSKMEEIEELEAAYSEQGRIFDMGDLLSVLRSYAKRVELDEIRKERESLEKSNVEDIQTDENQEKQDVQEVSDTSSDFERDSRDVEKKSEDYEYPDIDIQSIIDDTNLYQSQDFGKRVNIEEFELYIWPEYYCPIHGELLEKIQVVATYGKGKKFGVIVDCCKKCKRLYVSPFEVNSIVEDIRQKKIPYIIKRVK